MSDFQKFENTDTWRNKLRNFLLKESQPQSSLPRGFQVEETNRYSFDISEDLKNLIEEKKKHKKVTELPKTMEDCENKENENGNQVVFDVEKVNAKNYKRVFVQFADDTLMENDTNKREISDESFEAMELMCNKTASDQNSTLFQYLHTNQKSKVVEEVKKRLSGNEELKPAVEDPETAAINRLLDGLRMEEQREIVDESPLKGVEMTQIEDIEAPSRFWDSTILQTSPVKMVGLLRPSTILECAEVSDVSSAQASFKSARRDVFSEVSNSCYETASDTMSLCNEKYRIDEPDQRTNEDLIDLEKTIHITEIKQESIDIEGERKKPKVKVEKLIDLTIDPNLNDISGESEESIIELLSDDEPFEDQQHKQVLSTPLIKFENVTLSSMDAASTSSDKGFCEQDVLSTSASSREPSLHFNDTLEEVEYMMQKGLEFMAGAGVMPNQSPFKPKTMPSPLSTQKQHTFTKSPATKECLTPKNEVLSKTSAQKNHSAQKSENNYESRFALNIKPIPKLDLFKKPLSNSKPVRKPASSQKDKFAHVVSPIGTYIKKSAKAPFLAEVKTGSDDKNSSVFRELDFDSRQCKPDFAKPNTDLLKSPITGSLPKKAYISSEYRQVVDERNAVTIPGDKRLQKYLDAAALPAVVQHDGKANLDRETSATLKLPMKSHRFGEPGSHIPKRSDMRDNSLANLSLASGDVSLYTLKDAQRL